MNVLSVIIVIFSILGAVVGGDDVKKGALLGATYGILLVFLSRCFIRNVSGMFSLIGKIVKLDGELAKQVTQILEQLKTAKIISPWFVVPLIGLLFRNV